jgi:hypothetical protein
VVLLVVLVSGSFQWAASMLLAEQAWYCAGLDCSSVTAV